MNPLLVTNEINICTAGEIGDVSNEKGPSGYSSLFTVEVNFNTVKFDRRRNMRFYKKDIINL